MDIGNVTLRPYQAEHVEKFLTQKACLISYGKRGGKSIAALAITHKVMERGEAGPVLIISDKTSPWTRDHRKIGYPPEVLHLIYDNEESPHRQAQAKTRFREALAHCQPGHFYQIHRAAVTSEFGLLANIPWLAVIGDELHGFKNRNAQRTKALKKIPTRYKIGLTADPNDCNPQDIWSLLNWLQPKQYTSFWRWVQKYVEVSEEYGQHGKYFKLGAPINVEEFRAEIEPFFVKMSLEEIDPGQVPHIYEERIVGMTSEQQEAYDQMVEWQMMQLGDDMVIADYTMIANMRMQQLAQAMGRPEFRKVWRTVEVWNSETRSREKRRQLCDTVTIRQIEPSPKLDDLMYVLQCTNPRPEFDPDNIPDNAADLLRDTAPGPTVIFSQFPGMVDLACKRMDRLGIKYIRAHNDAQSIAAEEKFQSGAVDILIGSTGVISESLELDRAQTLMFVDCPWNPRVRGQAIGRGQAVGKRTPLRIIDFRTRGTVDFARLDRVRTRQQWKDMLLGRETYDDQHATDCG